MTWEQVTENVHKMSLELQREIKRIMFILRSDHLEQENIVEQLLVKAADQAIVSHDSLAAADGLPSRWGSYRTCSTRLVTERTRPRIIKLQLSRAPEPEVTHRWLEGKRRSVPLSMETRRRVSVRGQASLCS